MPSRARTCRLGRVFVFVAMTRLVSVGDGFVLPVTTWATPHRITAASLPALLLHRRRRQQQTQRQQQRLPSPLSLVPPGTQASDESHTTIQPMDSTVTSTSTDVVPTVDDVHNCQHDWVAEDTPFFGSVYRIRLPGQEASGNDDSPNNSVNKEPNDDSFLGAMEVPTFAATGSPNRNKSSNNNYRFPVTHTTPRARGLEGVLRHGPAFCLDHVLSPQECRDIIQVCEQQLGFGSYQAGKNHHGAIQIVVPPAIATRIGQTLGRHIDIDQVEERRREMESQPPTTDTNDLHGKVPQLEDVRLTYAGLNRRWRVYRYSPGGTETFAPHIDAGFPPSGLSADGAQLVWDDSADDATVISRLTVLFYLNDNFTGGATNFYAPCASNEGPSPLVASVRPVAGSCLVFPQGVGEDAVEYARQSWCLHEGSPVLAGAPKYVVRSDLLFSEERTPLPSLDDRLFRYDEVVRDTFLPQSPVWNRNFLAHVQPLYNPHMGVENMGPLLYSFVRFVKARNVVEIGAGYTSLWILQALRDNDEEVQRIQALQRAGQCKLLNWPWTVVDYVEDYNAILDDHHRESSLLCVDNCEHQKETATGATAIAKSLGLDAYLRLWKQDAFELRLNSSSIDVLWCDFGVGARTKEFVEASWDSLRPGGFLLCHSTLTNRQTRSWLEAVRARQGADVTGLPPDEYVEVSLLEPHKQYQNSITILQKRDRYTEPLYSLKA
ncbi:predicted protein [Phaeodactylum tricornutum CCAP 1055/1]|uniref:Fe2OG dioxygenase domain-containing protein n=1 Tax=Phaeodactylum tricornutum (strain CCAP 1055/1) TaxID=556484 RepID=B7G3M8_PHATC|nr:predicted protein [Phaeodactylum tricornutum CCAP 1055/1]EEC46855.1 predicted protein [Phaeodactylum tricornutum CCAP 1055/1]|eukprot:XP_002181641.1 predicted protein [Phaeodactylum tricornutum CCAP 1055/1]